ncbi:MAG: nicotinate-nucleotide adenylyltransferase [Chitinophagaceae bacterium]|jgi:nicotinate-nucleotide adenylyltransferase|nr:nicotinate-nucleotide adenylyltransferase [Chitinophagaceae bacterium]
MNIGLYFGSFNPIHVGHLIIASHIADNSTLDQVWFVVSPQNPLKPAQGLLNEYHRLHLTQVAVLEDPRMRVSDVEFKLPKPSYTIDTLTYLEEKYPGYAFTVILGSDSFQNIQRWKNADLLIKNFSFIVYPRPGFTLSETNSNVEVIAAPLLEISATTIRNNIKEGKSVRYLLPDNVREEIERSGYYK